jgi:hypothetical protein
VTTCSTLEAQNTNRIPAFLQTNGR